MNKRSMTDQGVEIFNRVVEEAEQRGHKHRTMYSGAGAFIGAVTGSFLGVAGSIIGAAVGSAIGCALNEED